MQRQCKNVCKTKYGARPFFVSAYLKGFKYCKNCVLVMDWDGAFCPCCAGPLRTKPRIKQSQWIKDEMGARSY